MVLPLDTAPGPSPDEESARNMEISENFLRQAREELAQGDLLQAASKAWGAAAYAIKAVAEKRRWFNDADWRLQEAAWVITAEQRDSTIMLGYLSARQAHYHFYHHEYHPHTYEQIIDATAVMVAKIDTLLASQDSPPYVDEQTQQVIDRLQNPTSAMDAERLSTGRKSMSDRPPAVPPGGMETSQGNGTAGD